MSDFIVTCDEETASWIGNDAYSMKPLVRCRNCKYMSRDTSYFKWCNRIQPEFVCDPNGFCSWGIRKEIG